jgi:16S rRNA (adenine1518-N6/adenine1519-N6)-dimethyltransferase
MILTSAERLKNRLLELPHQAKKSLGQNFLVSDHVIQKIILSAERMGFDSVVEIGPGMGALTDLLLPKFKKYLAIELDRDLAQYWRNKNIDLIEADALRLNWQEINIPLLVSNLPYQISSSLVIELSTTQNSIQSMVLMFQKEVAQRIRAVAQTEEYGMLSVIAQEFWTIETVCDAGPKDFQPPPKIASRVLGFKRRQSQIQNPGHYLQFVKKCFQQRRRVLKSQFSDSEKELLIKAFEKMNLGDKVRAEELSPLQFNQLYMEYFAKIK